MATWAADERVSVPGHQPGVTWASGTSLRSEGSRASLLGQVLESGSPHTHQGGCPNTGIASWAGSPAGSHGGVGSFEEQPTTGRGWTCPHSLAFGEPTLCTLSPLTSNREVTTAARDREPGSQRGRRGHVEASSSDGSAARATQSEVGSLTKGPAGRTALAPPGSHTRL